MKEKHFLQFLGHLNDNFYFYAPKKIGKNSVISKIASPDEIDFSGKIPENTWKQLLFSHDEELLDFSSKQIAESKIKNKQRVAFGINVLDLRAIALFEHVFGQDVLFQKRRLNSLIIGYSNDWPINPQKYKIFSHDFEKDVLAHLIFDIFIAKDKNNEYLFYTGTKTGQKLLEKYGINDYANIDYIGSSPKTAMDKTMLGLQKKIEKSYGKKIWDDLGKICIACGKCSITCPTCYCFDFEDKSDPQNAGRVRKWGNCFYNDFSKVAGGDKPLETVKQRIYFWYTHKFVRIPREYKIPGCVSCGRCSKVCPVGIKINEVLKKI